MDTKIWGPSAWLFIHTIAWNYNPERDGETEAYRIFFTNIENVLPCPGCRKHYKKHFDKLELEDALKTNKSMWKWSVMMHNRVNKSIGRPTWSENKAEEWLKQIYKDGIMTNNNDDVKYLHIKKQKDKNSWSNLFTISSDHDDSKIQKSPKINNELVLLILLIILLLAIMYRMR